jgi:predicted component of type VI protein secretion system
MAYLLDPSQQGRAAELQGAFADLMVHEVALLNGITEGARAMLSTLSPEAVEAAAPGGRWPMRAQALWKAYEARFHELCDEEASISEALFGKEFARAYGTIVGRGEPEGGGKAPGRR